VHRSLSLLFVSVFGCAAISAANLAHGATFVLTRAGLVISPYQAYSHGAVVPALLTACALGSVAFLNVLGEGLAKAARLRDDWLEHVATHIGKTSPLRTAPALLAAQLLVLIAMERAEQVAALGHPLSLAASFGAPSIVVLAVHVLVALIVAFTLSRACRALVIAVRAIADAISRPMFYLCARRPTTSEARRLTIHVRSRIPRPAPLAFRAANRPPPLSAAAAI
jgi:hypothetical protein